jgi:lipopolysaccharide transport system permease protein
MNPHRSAALSPLSLLRSVSRNRSLLAQMVRRDVAQDYEGSHFGLLWGFAAPAFMLVVYTFLFAGIFGARWNEGGESKLHFGLILFTGLIVHGCFAELVNRSASLVLTHANYVKRVVFPLEILPLMGLGTAAFHALIGFAVVVLGLLLMDGVVPLAVLCVPVIVLPLLLLSLGLSWLLASIGVYVRDIGQVVGLLTTALLFVSPVFYPASAVPPAYRGLLHLNPLAFFIEQVRGAIIWGRWPDWPVLAAFYLGALVVAWAGYAWFQLTRKGFADVL